MKRAVDTVLLLVGEDVKRDVEARGGGGAGATVKAEERRGRARRERKNADAIC